ncbi:MAG: hypothetical protein ABI164_12140, partial [Acidobacteriaceae bacterium]
MLIGNKTFRRLRRVGVLVVFAVLAGSSLPAQSNSQPSAFSAPSSTPVAPVGTTFTAASGN